MSTTNKSNGREYTNKSNPNLNKSQTMSYRNTLTNNQYSNSSNGDSYPYEDKSQHSSNSPKTLDNHGMQQHNTCPREPYYKTSINRNKQYHHNKNYNDKHNNYYSQRSCSPEDIIIPEIDHLREFIKEQADRFKIELSRHEGQTSNSPSPGSNQYSDHSNNRYNKSYGSLGRTGNGLSASHSLCSIANSSNNVSTAVVATASPSCSDNSNRYQDPKMGSNSFNSVKSNANGYNYAKHSSQSSGKPSPGLTRNFSHEETFAKSPGTTNNKNRNDSPSNITDKSGNIKASFSCQNGPATSRSDPKKASYRPNPYTFASGANPAMHQMNQNNSITASSLALEVRKNEQTRPTMSSVVRNGTTNGTSKPQNRRSTTGTVKLDGECDPVQNYRAVVSLAETNARRVSHSGSTTDSQEVIHSAIDTPTTQEQFFTPDHSASPCSNRSSPEVVVVNFQPQRGARKPSTPRISNNE